MRAQIRDHRNVLRASSLGTKGRTGQGPTIGRKNPPLFDTTAVQIAERWDLMLMLICETLSPLPIEIKLREREREMSEGWVLLDAERRPGKDKERYFSIKTMMII